jgi:hypothetical protein
MGKDNQYGEHQDGIRGVQQRHMRKVYFTQIEATNGCMTRSSELKSAAAQFTRVFELKKPTCLSTQLRETAPYHMDAGWRQTATLLLAAADEVETLQQRLACDMEAPLSHQSGDAESASKIIQFPPSVPTAKQA